MNDFLFGLAGAIGTAVVGVVGTWIAQVLKNRDKEQLRQRAVKQAQDEISMIDAWIKAHAALSLTSQAPDLVQDQARQDLDAVYGRMREAAAQPAHRRSITFQEVLSRIFLRPLDPHGVARFFRLIYYFSLVMIIVWAGAAASQQKSWTDPGELITSLFAFVLLGIVPAWFLAWLTITLAHRSDPSAARGHSRSSRSQPDREKLSGTY